MSVKTLSFHILSVVLLGLAVAAHQPAFAQTVDQSARISLRSANEKSTLDRQTRVLTSSADIFIANVSTQTLLGPFHAVMDLSAAGVAMPGASGGPDIEPYNRFYFDLTGTAGGSLAPGEEIMFHATLVRPATTQVSYQVRFFAAEISIDPQAPVEIQVSPPLVTVAAGETATIHVTGTRGDGSPVSLTAAPFIPNGAFVPENGNPASGEFTLNSDLTQAGEYLVRFTARGNDGQNASETALIKVQKTNRAPTLTGPATAQINEGQLLGLTLAADDPDGDPVTVTAGDLPEGALFVEPTRTLNFIPSSNQQGTYTIEFQASDGELSSPVKVVTITVHDGQAGGGTGGNATTLTLQVDPPQSPTFVASQRITGAVNGVGGGEPPQPATMALITGLDAASGKQGEKLTVKISGTAAGAFATHFAAGESQAVFGSGIIVESLDVIAPGEAIAHLQISAVAAPGPRAVMVTTGLETAVSVVAFNVVQGLATIEGTIVDPDSGLPIAGAVVSIQGTTLRTITDQFGHFRLSGFIPGSYTLVVNAPDHELIVFDFDGAAGAVVDLGSLKPSTTVFDPNAPAGPSIQSVLGRGLAEPPSRPDLAKLKQMIIDAFLVVGGPELGVLDEYGNQINDAVTSAGLVSATPACVDRLALLAARGDSIALQDILFVFSFGFEWTGQPPSLDEWLTSLQALVNNAWQDPHDPENAILILIFNRGRSLLPDPPTLNPGTRLSTLQAHLLVMSLLTYIAARDAETVPIKMAFDEQALLSTVDADFSLRSIGYRIAQAPPPPGDTGPRPLTRFWRNFFSVKSDFINASINQSIAQATVGLLINHAISSSPSVLSPNTAAMNQGPLTDNLNATLLAVQAASYAPQEPTIVSARALVQDDGTTQVQVNFRRSPSEQTNPGLSFVYSLYRFQGDFLPIIVAQGNFSSTTTLVLTDPHPIKGTAMYTMTVTRFASRSAYVDQALRDQFWGTEHLPFIDVFAPLPDRLTSEFSIPKAVYVGSIDFGPSLDALEIDPDPRKDVVYYSDTTRGSFYKLAQGGLGARTKFADSNFKQTFRDGRIVHQIGLAIDAQGNLYSENASSDEQFGGRIFKYFQPDGRREFTGSINYFSQMLFFARPTLSGPMAIRPAAIEADQQLFIVDNQEQMIKLVPVNATYDPYRRIGQPFAALPPGGDGRVVDMEVAPDGKLYMIDGFRVMRFETDHFELDSLFSRE